MSTKANAEPEHEAKGHGLKRRGFLIASALSAAAAACSRLWTDSSGPDVRADRLQEFANYPMPTYVPQGYELWMEQDDRLDGFRGVGTQNALMYRGPRASTTDGSRGTRYPLLFFATEGSNWRLAGTETQEGVRDLIRFSDARTALILYYDGMWEPVRAYDNTGNRVPGPPEVWWSRLNFHCVVYQWGNFQIAIRGSRRCGIQYDDLLKIASSIGIPATT